jgi:hypothetical protein
MTRTHIMAGALAVAMAAGALSSETASAAVSSKAPATRSEVTTSMAGHNGYGQPGAANGSNTINRPTTRVIPGTNCSITVGGYVVAPYYPSVASQVSCNSRHNISVDNQIWDANLNGTSAHVYVNWGYYNYINAFGTREIDDVYASCPGTLLWSQGALVYIDGVYRGGFYTPWGQWTACTYH